MIRRIVCLLWGHEWKQKGYTRIRNYGSSFKNDDYIDTRDHFLFVCRKCCKIKEYTCKTNYEPIAAHEEDLV